MKYFIPKAILIAFFLLFAVVISAQIVDYKTSKEKIYIQTNHVFFKSGEQIFFKIYVVDAKDNKPTAVSSSVNVEIINPAGNISQKSVYKIDNGYAEGSYDFLETAVGGVYKLKAYTTWMQNEKDSTFFTKEITLQKVIAPRVLMKLDFPKKGYGAGDEVIAEFSMKSLSDEPIKNQTIQYNIFLKGTSVGKGKTQTNYSGKTQIIFSLPKDLSTNDGLLNVTVDYDSYTESISRSIPLVLNKIDIQFMPEGGSFVNNIKTNVAFKAVNEFGKPTDLKGVILDSKGNKITEFESYHFGMGKFFITPKYNEQYIAVITSPSTISQTFKLPIAKLNGTIMNCSLTKDDKIIFRIESSSEGTFTLQGNCRNVNFYKQKIQLKEDNFLTVDAKLFPTGITQFTLLNKEGIPIAERLVFLNRDKVLNVSIIADKQKYLPRERVHLTLKTLDESGNPIPSNFSMTVIDDKLWTYADDKQDHILSWLLMSSELKGKVEEPMFYFKKEETKSLEALDLLMLTQGYRYFEFTEYVKESGKLKFSPDLGSVLSGKILNKQNKPVKATVYLVNAYSGTKAFKMETDEDGVYCFTNLEPLSRYYLLAMSSNRKTQVHIEIEQNGMGYNPILTRKMKRIEVDKGKEYAAINPLLKMVKEDERKIVKQNEDAFKNQNLDEVVVVAYGMQKRKEMSGSVTIVKANDLGFVQEKNVANALQGRIAGVQINANPNPGASPNIMIRGSRSISGDNNPLFVVNGVIVSREIVNTLNPADIESVTVLKDATASALYGSSAANGAIIIESKKFKKEKIKLGLTPKSKYATSYIYSGAPVYNVAKKFYAPLYQILETEVRNDFRENIYWNGVIQTNNTGLANIEFSNSDATTTFRAIAEGIAFNGILGRAETTYAAQSAITVDVKIPPYLTVGDSPLIPVNIKNNSNQPLEMKIDIASINGIKIGSFNNSIYLDTSKSTQVLIPLEVTNLVNGKFHLEVSGQFSTEKIELPITASQKGFSITNTFAGSISKQHSFNVNKIIPSSLKTELRLFKNIEGQLLDGIESMLHEPYGCFEQTSSTTYPNVFILKYLKESKKLNPQIEKKALDYIERGYRRLIGFETSENGFEWFGKAPAHEALTAYGLLEFTDMQEFINVDDNMLKRTKEFLLKRRDGNGNFKIASGGYDRFASVPNKIANLYIVYALTQAGVKEEIKLEYATAIKQAINSKDGYQMAMMAIAASNMNNQQDYNTLMQQLEEHYSKQNLNSETSVVNSRDASLRVEAKSLYVLALAKDKNPNIALMATLVSQILSEKTYYGYGSTQATVLALNAIVTYSKLIGVKTQDAAIDFTVNQLPTTAGNNISNIVEGNNTFTVQYQKADQNIPYQLQVTYNTFTPPNSDKAEITLSTKLAEKETKLGETVRMEIEATNIKPSLQPMTIAKIGIPAGLAVQPWQLKELVEKNQVAYYEIFDNYLVFYWMGFAIKETKRINLDLKAEIPGTYKAKASNIYLYYTPEYKHWNDGAQIIIHP